MTAAVLYVAAAPVEPGGVLSTPEPLPTDQLPEWWLCSDVGFRLAPSRARVVKRPDCCVPDGPFPVTVGRWEHRCTCAENPRHALAPGDGCIVELVTVSGPSHHADECGYGPLDAPPDRWHTPTSAVTRLDVPIPMERPPRCDCEDVPVPASWWWAELPLEVPA